MKNIINIGLVGHRPGTLAGYDLDIPFYQQLQRELVLYIKEASLTNTTIRCHTGMSLGAETIWALAVLDAKKDVTILATIELIVHIPYITQAHAWFDKKDRSRWLHIKKCADETIIHADISHCPENQQKQYAIEVIHENQHKLIEQCDILIAVYNGDTNSDIAHIIQSTVGHTPVFRVRVDRDTDIDE